MVLDVPEASHRQASLVTADIGEVCAEPTFRAVITFPPSTAGTRRDEWVTILNGLLPGAFLAVAASSPTGYATIANALEAAGAEIRDCIIVPTGDSPTNSSFVLLARKPLVGTVAETLLTYRTGGINLAAGRLPGPTQDQNGRLPPNVVFAHHPACRPKHRRVTHEWVCDPGCVVAHLDATVGIRRSGTPGTMRLGENRSAAYGTESRPPGTPMVGYGDEGGPSRFFAAIHDRTALAARLAALLIPPDGPFLDPYADTAPCLLPWPGTMVCSSAAAAARLATSAPTPLPDPATEPTGSEPVSLFGDAA